jgi:tripartite-type tricarboxylate transporter receptor subunit TctC
LLLGTAIAGAASVTGGLLAPRLFRPAPAYPSRPVTIVLPFTAGRPAAMVVRAIAAALKRRLGQPFVLDFRAGSNGINGATAVTKAPADGYTLLFAFAHTLVNNVALHRKLPYDPQRDFALITQIGWLPSVLATHSGLRASNVAKFVDAVHAQSRQVSYGSTGEGTLLHLAGEVLLNRRLGLNAKHVPYRDAAAMTRDLVAGQITVAFGALSAFRRFTADGRLRALAIAGDTRVSALPLVHTLAEQGHDDPIFRVRHWGAFLAPTGTPEDIVMVLNAAVIAALDAPEVQAMLDAMGFERIANTPHAARALLERDLGTASPLIRNLGIEAQ